MLLFCFYYARAPSMKLKPVLDSDKIRGSFKLGLTELLRRTWVSAEKLSKIQRVNREHSF